MEGFSSSALCGLIEGSVTHLIKVWRSAQDASLWPFCLDRMLERSLDEQGQLSPFIDCFLRDEQVGLNLAGLKSWGTGCQRDQCGPLRQDLPWDLKVLSGEGTMSDVMYRVR